jgi:hypothetical protein
MTRVQVEKMRERERTRASDALKTVKSGSYRVTLRGATHQSFSDESLILPFGDANAKAANRRRTKIIREFTLAFFEQSLRRRNSTLLNGSAIRRLLSRGSAPRNRDRCGQGQGQWSEF